MRQSEDTQNILIEKNNKIAVAPKECSLGATAVSKRQILLFHFRKPLNLIKVQFTANEHKRLFIATFIFGDGNDCGSSSDIGAVKFFI